MLKSVFFGRKIVLLQKRGGTFDIVSPTCKIVGGTGPPPSPRDFRPCIFNKTCLYNHLQVRLAFMGADLEVEFSKVEEVSIVSSNYVLVFFSCSVFNLLLLCDMIINKTYKNKNILFVMLLRRGRRQSVWVGIAKCRDAAPALKKY